MLDLFRADGALRQRLGIVEPRFFEAELPGRAALQIRDEHGIVRALPFEVSGRDQAAVKLLQTAARVREFPFRGRFAGGDKDAVKTSLSGIAVELASDVFGDFPRGDAIL